MLVANPPVFDGAADQRSFAAIAGFFQDAE
jgi:hypothetical protein